METPQSQSGTTQISYKRSPSEYLSKVPLWALIILAGGFFLLYLILADPNYHTTFVYLTAGMKMTLKITLMAFPIATVIGLFTGLARSSKNILPFTIATMYVEIIRGIPLVVLILMIAFAVVPLYVNLVNIIGAWGVTLVTSGDLNNFFNTMSEYSIRSIPMDIRCCDRIIPWLRRVRGRNLPRWDPIH